MQTKWTSILLASVVSMGGLGAAIASTDNTMNNMANGIDQTGRDVANGTMDAVNGVGQAAGDVVDGTGRAIDATGKATSNMLNGK